MSHVTTPLAILVGSIIIAAAVMGGNLINRYRVELWQSPHVLRLDTVTGEVCRSPFEKTLFLPVRNVTPREVDMTPPGGGRTPRETASQRSAG